MKTKGPISPQDVFNIKQDVKRFLQRQQIVQEATREFQEENFPFGNINREDRTPEPEIVPKTDGMKPFLKTLTDTIEALDKRLESVGKDLRDLRKIVVASTATLPSSATVTKRPAAKKPAAKKRGPYKKRAKK